jgi:hypothetical protein
LKFWQVVLTPFQVDCRATYKSNVFANDGELESHKKESLELTTGAYDKMESSEDNLYAVKKHKALGPFIRGLLQVNIDSSLC